MSTDKNLLAGTVDADPPQLVRLGTGFAVALRPRRFGIADTLENDPFSVG
jgi:hypothetical protein